jgi:hypothetical protein
VRKLAKMGTKLNEIAEKYFKYNIKKQFKIMGLVEDI